MEEQQERHVATADGLTISPSLDFVIDASQTPVATATIDRRVVWMCALAIGLGLIAAFVAQGLMKLIAFITNLSFYGRFSLDFVGPADNHLGLWVIAVPMAGAVVIGLLADTVPKPFAGMAFPRRWSRC